jgi:hypothetical protein
MTTMQGDGDGSAAAGRRPQQYWRVFNAWWRDELRTKGLRPGQTDIELWYAKHALAAFHELAATGQSIPLLRNVKVRVRRLLYGYPMIIVCSAAACVLVNKEFR